MARNKHLKSELMTSVSIKFLTDYLLPPGKEGLVVGISCIVLIPLDGVGTQLAAV